MPTMSRHLALLIATESISQIDGCNPSWRFRVPVSSRDLDGQMTTVTTETYLQARRKRTEAVVQLALNLTGVHGTIEFEGTEAGSARKVLDRVLADTDFYVTAD